MKTKGPEGHKWAVGEIGGQVHLWKLDCLTGYWGAICGYRRAPHDALLEDVYDMELRKCKKCKRIVDDITEKHR